MTVCRVEGQKPELGTGQWEGLTNTHDTGGQSEGLDDRSIVGNEGQVKV